ncbi:hypothetical protein PVL29_022913 [Vitis rotundifolia]|uniref:Nascent polypeptide-associated complex subunit beta n=1 Tax=Vitis rotundifolia TaxID=103349 RepID=A0AA38YX16_VITRO|nr:hypothetical protein PVL29_022913 [Vitis rotundifolia]
MNNTLGLDYHQTVNTQEKKSSCKEISSDHVSKDHNYPPSDHHPSTHPSRHLYKIRSAVENGPKLSQALLSIQTLALTLAKMNREKLMKMAGAVRTGGKGSMRRKKKAVHKTTTTDDKRLQSTLKRIGVNAIPAIEEVNIFKDDVVIQFLNPKGNVSQLCILFV